MSSKRCLATAHSIHNSKASIYYSLLQQLHLHFTAIVDDIGVIEDLEMFGMTSNNLRNIFYSLIRQQLHIEPFEWEAEWDI